MVHIKVLKLSDLVNRGMYVVGSFLLLWFCSQWLWAKMEQNSWNMLTDAIQNQLGIDSGTESWKKIMFLSLPILKDSPPQNDDVELAENSSSKQENKEETSTRENSPRTKQEELTLVPPYLLEWKQLSDSKYQIGSITINDYTKKKLDFDELEKALFTEVEPDCKVLIYHTHTSEGYTGSDENNQYRSEDSSANVVRVGEALKEELTAYGIQVRQDTSQHDYPSYNGAYKSSLNTVETILKNENYDIILDIHRDALASNAQYRPTAEINGETVAKLMFVVGTNAAGLKHDNWMENLKFAIAFQQRANELYPGLFRDLHLSTSRYNQHTSPKALIVEVGATGNTMEEACLAMKYFAKVLQAMRQANSL